VFGCGGKSAQSSSTPGASGTGASNSGGASENPSGGNSNTGATGPVGGATNDADEGGAGASLGCKSDFDCPPASCASCKDTQGGCPPSNCVMGQCFAPSCATIDACAQKICGDACSACYSEDGQCSQGVCDQWGDCKDSVASCDINAPRPCTPSDAAGAGFVNGKTCNVVQGWGWNGSHCAAIVGCVCQGSDCRSLLQTESDCSGAFIGCLHQP